MNKPSASPDDPASIDALTKAGLSAAEALLTSLGELAKLTIALNPILKFLQDSQRRSSCDIPPACWLPRSLGEVRSFACPGGTASVRIRVTNCQGRTSFIKVVARPNQMTKVQPDTATLEPMERKSFNISVSVPQDSCKGQKLEFTLWVLGCNAHYLRWTVEISETTSATCQEVDVEDCQDYVHHWYDHFYCDRPCFQTTRKSTEIGS